MPLRIYNQRVKRRIMWLFIRRRAVEQDVPKTWEK
jgi:hypothetical protein